MSTPIDIPGPTKEERSLSEQFDAQSAESKERILSLVGTKPTSKYSGNIALERLKEENSRKYNENLKQATTPKTRSMLKHWGVYNSPPS